MMADSGGPPLADEEEEDAAGPDAEASPQLYQRRSYVDADGWPVLSPPMRAEKTKERESTEPLSPLGPEMSSWKKKSLQLTSSIERYTEEQDAGSGKGVAKMPNFIKDKDRNFSNHDDASEWWKPDADLIKTRRPKMTEMQKLMHKPTQRERGRGRIRRPLEGESGGTTGSPIPGGENGSSNEEETKASGANKGEGGKEGVTPLPSTEKTAEEEAAEEDASQVQPEAPVDTPGTSQEIGAAALSPRLTSEEDAHDIDGGTLHQGNSDEGGAVAPAAGGHAHQPWCTGQCGGRCAP